MSVLVGFGHKKRQGKDTAVASIIKAFGSKYLIQRFAFADELKREYTKMCEEAGGAWDLLQVAKVRYALPDWVQYEFDAPMDDPLCPYGKQRSFLQFWGQYRREQESTYWIKLLAKQILKASPQFALIPDMRYQNEAAWVKLCGGFTVKVTRGGLVQDDPHISEHDLDSYGFDFELVGEDGAPEKTEGLALGFFSWLLDHLNPKPTAMYGECNELMAN